MRLHCCVMCWIFGVLMAYGLQALLDLSDSELMVLISMCLFSAALMYRFTGEIHQ